MAFPGPSGAIGGTVPADAFVSLVESCPDAILVDSGGRIVIANAAAFRLLGARRRSELEVRGVLDFVAPAERDAVRALLGASPEAGASAPIRCSLGRLDGSIVEVEIRTVAMSHAGGRATGVFVRDERSLRSAERARRDADAQLAAFVRNLPCSAFLKDAGGRYVHASETLERVCGAAPGGIAGRTDADVFPPDVAARRAQFDAEALATGRTVQRVEARPHADGVHQWLVSRFPVPALDGPPRIGGIGIDLTERLRAEQERIQILEAERAARDSAVRRLEAIQAVTDAALAHLALDDLLCELLGRVRSLLAADTATIFLMNQDDTSLSVRATSGLEPGSHAPVPLGAGVAGTVAATCAPFAVEDVTANADMQSVVDRSQRSLLGAPLLVEGRPVGVIEVGSVRRRKFAEDEISLLQVVADRVAPAIDRARLHDAVLEGSRRLTALSRRLLDVQESERRRIARELHDEIGQLVTGLKLRIEIGGACPRGTETREIVDDLMARVRDMSMNLMPPMLEDLGLLPALLWHVQRYTAQTRVQVRFRHAGLDRRFPRDVELAAFRVAQEGLTNVAKHAHVGEAKLDVWASADGLGVQVEDDGAGFACEADATGASVGLPGMRERVRLVGGQLSVDSAPGAGTRLSAFLPVQSEPSAEL